MTIIVSRPEGPLTARIQLPTSKSISNRALIIRALGDFDGPIEGLSDADDTKILHQVLNEMPTTMNVGNAGTVMRFLCAFLSIQDGVFHLEGSERMYERPIAPLVNALRELGADIQYLRNDGFPPLRIQGGIRKGGTLKVDSSISSQFASALMMIAPYLKNGLILEMGNMASRSYLEMTENIMSHFGIEIADQNGVLQIPEGEYVERAFRVPVDHSSASYWAGMAALSKSSEFFLEGLHLEDPQGDRVIFEMLEPLIESEQKEDGLWICKKVEGRMEDLQVDLSSTPDLFPTLAFLCAGLGVEAHISGLGSLPHKETDRLIAVQKELENIGIIMKIEGSQKVHIAGGGMIAPKRPFRSYGDHRMAMSAAMLGSLFTSIEIEDLDVVEKSYPTFWKDLESAGFRVNPIG